METVHTQPDAIVVDVVTPGLVDVTQAPHDPGALTEIPVAMETGEPPPDDPRGDSEDRGTTGQADPHPVGTEGFTATDLGAILATIEA
ncbi:MAG: hypothetical protein EBT22_01765, partial [Chloroflexi bacterium]|nr:hypothetical protein [Chloroflexota bacterium]